MMYGLYNGYGWNYGMMNNPFGLILMVAFWLVIVVLIVWGAREIRGNHQSGESRALDILKERYAKGEINKEEFETKKKDLLN